MEENLQNKKYLTVKELIFYSLGLFGLQAIIFYINSYQVEFYSGSGMIEAFSAKSTSRGLLFMPTYSSPPLCGRSQ